MQLFPPKKKKKAMIQILMLIMLTLSAPTPQNGQTHSNNSSVTANEFFERVWPFCGVGAWRVRFILIYSSFFIK